MAVRFWWVTLVALLCTIGCSTPRETVSDLSQAWARVGPLRGPGPALGQAKNRMYLGQGWERGSSPEYRECVGSRSVVRFFADHARSLNLTLEGQGGPARVRVLLNEKTLGQVELKGDLVQTSLPVEKDLVESGRNELTLVGGEGSEWKLIEFKQASTNDKTVHREQGRIDLPFGKTLGYPVTAREGDVLVLGGLEDWSQPGVTPSQGFLQVTVVREEPRRAKSWKFEGPEKLELEPGPLNLILEAVPREPALPGQWGFQLHELTVQGPLREQSEAQETPVVKPEKLPNVVLYVIDTLRADRLGCYGFEGKTSPHLDELAKDGVVFEQAQAQSPWTKPSVASILSGLEPQAHGAVTFADKILSSVPNVTASLKQTGYHTGGWVANGWLEDVYGFGRGFDVYQLHRAKSAEFLREKAQAWLSDLSHEEPFFLYLHTVEPHVPYAPEEPFASEWAPGLRRFSTGQMNFAQEELRKAETLGEEADTGYLPRAKRLYSGEVACNDDSLGKLLNWLKEEQLYDNTLIIVVSDHGEEFLEHGDLNHVQSLYQELLWVPLVVKYPGQRNAGSRVSTPVGHTDIAPTILRVAGLAAGPEMEGAPLDELPTEPRPLLSHVDVGSDDTIYQKGVRPYLYVASSVRLGQMVLHQTRESRRSRYEALELYDLAKDPEQHKNLLFEKPVTALHLEAELQRKATVQTDKVSPEELNKTLKSVPYVH